MGRSLEGRISLVTGASEGGTGRAVAVRFAAEGAKVAITAPNEDGLRETLAMIEDVGSTGLVLPADFSDRNGPWRTLVERTEAELGPIDVLVNNAVTSLLQPFDVWTLEELERNQQVNVWVPWILMTQVLPRMRERGQGWILNLTSSAAELPPGPPYGVIARSGFAGYGANKASINRLTAAAAAETEHEPIAVNTLSPQLTIDTPSVPRTTSWRASSALTISSSRLNHPRRWPKPRSPSAPATREPSPVGSRTASNCYSSSDAPSTTLVANSLSSVSNRPTCPRSSVASSSSRRDFGGPDMLALDRPSTPLPAVLRRQTR